MGDCSRESSFLHQVIERRTDNTTFQVNSTISLVSDFCWAYATLLTSPILVTVGLSLSIPLSLIGQILLNSQTSTGMYWVGAAIVCIAFVIVNYEIEDSDPHVENFRLDSGSEQ